jgi:hypothetical protein
MDTTETAMDVATGTGAYIKDHSLVKVGTEVMYVSAHASADTLTVVRGWGTANQGTSGVASSSGATLTILGPASVEGGAFPDTYTTDTSAVVNYTQTMRYKLSVTGDAMEAEYYGYEGQDPLEYQMRKLWADSGQAGQAAKDLAMTFYHGQAVQRASGVGGSMGGLEEYVTTNATSGASQQIDLPKIHSMLRSIVDVGGEVSHIIGSTLQIEKIASLYEDQRRYTQESLLGGSEVQQIMTTAHPMPIKLVPDYLCPNDRVYFVNTDYVGWVPYREFDYKELPTANDAVDWGLVGTYTFVARKENCMGYYHTLATS